MTAFGSSSTFPVRVPQLPTMIVWARIRLLRFPSSV
jgi:hypothetical protein